MDVIVQWDVDNRPEADKLAEKPPSPAPATFEDIKAEHTALVQDYTMASNEHKEHSAAHRTFSS